MDGVISRKRRDVLRRVFGNTFQLSSCGCHLDDHDFVLTKQHDSSSNEYEDICPTPTMRNLEVVNEDGTIRPWHASHICATHSSNEIGSKLTWKSCEKAVLEQHHMTFQFEALMHANFTGHGYNPFSFPIGYIRSTTHDDRCWSIKNSKKAGSKSSNIMLKKCKSDAERQLWTIFEGLILLVNANMEQPELSNIKQNQQYKAFIGVPFLGEGEKLKTRQIYSTFKSDCFNLENELNLGGPEIVYFFIFKNLNNSHY